MKKKGSAVFHKNTFDKISPEKKDKIFTVAIAEFAAMGYNATNINMIAQKADISIGSLYSYFSSKEDLFLAMAEKGYELLGKALAELHPEEGTVFDVIERLLHITVNYAEQHTDFCLIYIDLSTETLSGLSERLSDNVETDYVNAYKELLAAAKEKGEVRSDLDVPMAAFFLDNLVVMLQLSVASSYYRSRIKLYLGEDGAQDREMLIGGLLALIKRAFS
ncbi:MAG TPA: AcrR family transcriptional regulator [Firmicutes bacterium]|jgi:AcrR family transcriptional regulator|nr:AcrR family transcriptional regulator [Bacillota bacterium]HAW71962.1 AcrR family transcriptional regulator [Bacillota bacterium]HAZ22514.1 AcrR family transcriptional regulator [Bacillota bacterium]HBE04963.1 AcrR family transcriptional regulator [Bacillota bacterium]HBG44950.1 AcrR family transcriptional regulator [Bacillota bacterium]